MPECDSLSAVGVPSLLLQAREQVGHAVDLFRSSSDEEDLGSAGGASSRVQFPGELRGHYFVRDATCDEGYEVRHWPCAWCTNTTPL
mgnify:FL=1